jgi:hypothetical protein
MEENIKVTIEGEGLSLTKLTTLQKAGQIISFLGYNNDKINLADDKTFSGVGAPLLPSNRQQPKDVIVNSKAKTYPQKIVALAKYLQEQMGQNTFTPQELKLLFKKMGDEPKNFTRDLKTALELQYVLCVDTATEQYELTSRGNDALSESFIGIEVKRNTGANKAVSSRGIRAEVKAFEIVGSMDGYPDYHNLTTKGDKILWLIQYADTKSVTSLTPSEVDYLSTQLREHIDASGFTALNSRNMNKCFVVKNSEGFQIQKRGVDYLANLNSIKTN